jgi:hypothetical protein
MRLLAALTWTTLSALSRLERTLFLTAHGAKEDCCKSLERASLSTSKPILVACGPSRRSFPSKQPTRRKKILIVAPKQVNNYDLSENGQTSWTPDSTQPGYGSFRCGHREVTSIDDATLSTNSEGTKIVAASASSSMQSTHSSGSSFAK